MDEGTYIFQVNPESFQTDVVERSKNLPVLVLFWADQVQPSLETRSVLENIVNSSQGKIMLGLVDVAQDQTLAQHLQVQGLPSIRVVSDGQLVDQLDGPQPDNILREFVGRLTMSSVDILKDQLDGFLSSKDYSSALRLLEQAINEEPNNHSFRVELADVLILNRDLAEGRRVLQSIPEDIEDRDRPETRIAFFEEATEIGDLPETHRDNTEDLDKLCKHVVVAVIEQEYEYALESCLHILKTDREFRDDWGRVTMVRIFKLLGKGSDLATRYRRKMFAHMH